MRKRKLNELEILYAQFAIWKEKNLIDPKEILSCTSLEKVKKYLEEVYNGDIDKKKYYEDAKCLIGKNPYINVLRRNFLNSKNRAYVEFLKEV